MVEVAPRTMTCLMRLSWRATTGDLPGFVECARLCSSWR
jgi:hypothetical protein